MKLRSPIRRSLAAIVACSAVAGVGLGAWWVANIRVAVDAADVRGEAFDSAEARDHVTASRALPQMVPTETPVVVAPAPIEPSPQPPVEQELAVEEPKGTAEPPSVSPQRLAELQARVDSLDARVLAIWARLGEIPNDPDYSDPTSWDPAIPDPERQAALRAEYASLDAERLRLLVELADARFQRDIATFSPQY